MNTAAAARDERLARAYRRRGFQPDPAYPPALVRWPTPSTPAEPAG